MTQKRERSYVPQTHCKPEFATRRHRGERPDLIVPRVMHLPHNEWSYLLSKVKHSQGYLVTVLEEQKGLPKNDKAWIKDRHVEAEMLIDLIEGPEFRRGFLSWCESIDEELSAMSSDHSEEEN